MGRRKASLLDGVFVPDEFMDAPHEELDITEYTYKDWKKYWIKKHSEYNLRYIAGDARKEAAIIKSLMTKLDPYEIKELIDFLFDVDHRIKPREELGLYLLTVNWLPHVLAKKSLWKAGKLNKPSWQKEKPVREYKPCGEKKKGVKISI